MPTSPSTQRTLSLRTLLQVVLALCAAAPLALAAVPDVSDSVTVWTLGLSALLVAVIGAGWAAYEKVRSTPAPNTTPATRVIRTAVYVIAAVLTAAAAAVLTLPISFALASQIAGILGAVVIVLSAIWNTLEAAGGGTLVIDVPASGPSGTGRG